MNSSSLPQSSQTSEGTSSESNVSTSSLSQAKQGIKQAVRSATDTVKTKVSETATNLKNQTAEAVQSRKDAAAERIGGYSSAIHETADSLEEKDPNIAWFTHRAAERLQGVADYVRDRDFRTLKTDIEGVARRHPVAFFGGLLVAGLVIGNIVKATATNAARASHDEGQSDDFLPEESYDEESRPYSGVPQETGSYAVPQTTPPPSQI